jgi:hypothetical protein
MDKVERYREIVCDTILPLTARKYSGDKTTNEAVFDKENDRYIIVCVGWLDPSHRVYFNLVHIDIINGKVWIQYDGTEDGIGYALEAAGIPKEDIIPGFHPENIRPYTGYGVA